MMTRLSSPPALDGKRLLQYTLLLGITLLAAALRFYKLGAWSFWGDEMLTVVDIPDGFNYNIVRQSLSLTLIQMTIAALGVSEWSARLVPALVGILSIPILYVPIRRIFDPSVALVSSLFLAISPWHLYWSQNARFYSLLLLFYTLALLAFYIGLEEERPSFLILALLFLGLAVRERLLALFFVPVVAAYLIALYVLRIEKPRGLRLPNLAIFVLPALVLALFFAGPYLKNLPAWMVGFGRVNNNPFWLVAGVVYYVRLPIVCMAAAGGLYLLAQRHRAALLLGLGAIVPLLAIVAISPFHYTATRYIFVSLTSWLILASVAAVELFRRTDYGAQLLAVGVLFVLIADPLSEDILYYQYQNGNRDNWRAALALVAQQKNDGDVVISAHPQLGTYYLGETTISMNQVNLCRIAQSKTPVWFIEDMTTEELYPELHRWLAQHARLAGNFDVHVQARTFTMNVYRYEPAGDTVAASCEET